MKTFIMSLIVARSLCGIPVYEFFSKGTPEYYQTNAANIFDFFRQKLNWKPSPYLDLLNKCRTQYDSFALTLTNDLKVNIFQIKVNIDGPLVQQVNFYCKVNQEVIQQLAKLKKPTLNVSNYYQFRWDVLNSRLEIYSIEKSMPKVLPSGDAIRVGKVLPIHLSNVQNSNIIYFIQVTEPKDKASIHPMMDVAYPLTFNPQGREYDLTLIETNPLFFPTKTRELFSEFNKVFGIIPDRLGLQNQSPIAVMP